jgi:hypothetical protein
MSNVPRNNKRQNLAICQRAFLDWALWDRLLSQSGVNLAKGNGSRSLLCHANNAFILFMT